MNIESKLKMKNIFYPMNLIDLIHFNKKAYIRKYF